MVYCKQQLNCYFFKFLNELKKLVVFKKYNTQEPVIISFLLYSEIEQ